MGIENKSIKGDMHFWKTSFFSHFKVSGHTEGTCLGRSKINGGWQEFAVAEQKMGYYLFMTPCFFSKEDTKVMGRERINAEGI